MSIDLSFLIIAGVVVLFFLILFTFIPVGLWIAAISAGLRCSVPGRSRALGPVTSPAGAASPRPP